MEKTNRNTSKSIQNKLTQLKTKTDTTSLHWTVLQLENDGLHEKLDKFKKLTETVERGVLPILLQTISEIEHKLSSSEKYTLNSGFSDMKRCFEDVKNIKYERRRRNSVRCDSGDKENEENAAMMKNDEVMKNNYVSSSSGVHSDATTSTKVQWSNSISKTSWGYSSPDPKLTSSGKLTPSVLRPSTFSPNKFRSSTPQSSTPTTSDLLKSTVVHSRRGNYTVGKVPDLWGKIPNSPISNRFKEKLNPPKFNTPKAFDNIDEDISELGAHLSKINLSKPVNSPRKSPQLKNWQLLNSDDTSSDDEENNLDQDQKIKNPQTPKSRFKNLESKIEFQKLYREKNLLEVEHILNYQFHDKSLLVNAFISDSFVQNGHLFKNHKKLAFLGDAVLNFFITCEIGVKYPKLSLPEQASVKSFLISNRNFGEICIDETFHDYLIKPQDNSVLNIESFIDSFCWGNDDEIAAAGDIPKVLADLFEALAGAVFLDEVKKSEVEKSEVEKSKGNKECPNESDWLNVSLMPGNAGQQTWKIFEKLLSGRLDKACQDPPISSWSQLLKKYPKTSFILNQLTDGQWNCIVSVLNFRTGTSEWKIKHFDEDAGSKKLAKELAAKKALTGLIN